jgi:hypothetical protein
MVINFIPKTNYVYRYYYHSYFLGDRHIVKHTEKQNKRQDNPIIICNVVITQNDN